MPTWKDRWSGTGSKIVHEVAGRKERFWVIKTSAALKLRPLAQPLGRILAHLTQKQDHDYAVQQKHHSSPRADGVETFSETIMEPKPLDVIKFRAQQLREVVDEVVALIMAPENQQLAVDVIASSMREAFPDGAPEAEEFFDEVDLGTLKEMLVGVAKANMKMFGPFQQAMEAFSSRVIARAQEAVRDEDSESQDDPPAEPGPSDPTPGCG